LKTIIVDDDPAIREGLRGIVERLGAEVVAEAEDGRSAIERAKLCAPELILLDVSMPGMSGLAAARQLRQIMPDVPIIIISQHNNRVYAEEAMQSGAGAFVLKRSAVHDLAVAIPAVMAGRTFVSALITAARA
jgi:DNA-binding NarL/FixJ family response regulator